MSNCLNLIFVLNGQRIMMQEKLEDMFAEVALRYIQQAGLQEHQNFFRILLN